MSLYCAGIYVNSRRRTLCPQACSSPPHCGQRRCSCGSSCRICSTGRPEDRKNPLPAFRSAFSSGRERMLLKEFPAPFRVKKLQTGKAAPAALRFSRWSIRRRGRSAAEAAASASRSAGAVLRSPDPFYAVNPAIARPRSYLFSCSNYTIKPQKTQCFLRFCTYFLSFIGTMDLLRRY